MSKSFCISVGDEAFLTVDEIWPDGNAPDDPTPEDVIRQIKETSSRHNFATDWGFQQHVEVDGRSVW